MKQAFIRNDGNKSLLLFFAGWGSDERMFDIVPPDGYDYMVCFDYSDLSFDHSLIERYSEIRLMAWSMGVWVASVTLGGRAYAFEKRLAINGTMFPKNDELGIPVSVFEGTLAGLNERNLHKFRLRMCRTQEALRALLGKEPYRDVVSLRDELSAINTAIDSAPSVNENWHWDEAIVGTDDLIFPTANQLRAWEGTQCRTMPIAHYDEALFNDSIAGKDSLWTKS